MDYKDVIEKVFNDDFDKVNSYRYQDIINYLNNVNDSFTLETYFISMDDVLNKLNNNDYFVDLNMYASNNTLKCPFPFEKVIKLIKSINKDIIVFVDNCYCEFVEDKTPIQVGADITVGSLIKNLGAGICTHGAYVTGKKDLIKLVSERLYLAGEGKDVGPSIESNRMFLMGLYMSPSVVNSSLKSSILISKVMDRLNFNVSPKWNQERCDIVEILYLKNEENLINFATSIQESGPVNSGVLPTPGEMPGYSDKVIMASPSFTQGSSIEMSCDAPLRKPYALYIQGGLTYSYAKLALMNAVSNLKTRE